MQICINDVCSPLLRLHIYMYTPASRIYVGLVSCVCVNIGGGTHALHYELLQQLNKLAKHELQRRVL